MRGGGVVKEGERLRKDVKMSEVNETEHHKLVKKDADQRE